MSIESFPNQKMVQIHRDMPKQTKENKRPYVIAYTDVISEAAKNLGTKHTAFKLYLYFLCNREDYFSALSPQDFANQYGVSLKAAKDAVNELIAAGYLVHREKKTYDFYETPHNDEIEPVEEIRKKFKTKSGNVLELTFDELVEKIGDKKAAEEKWRNAQ